jgi:hypothetical protein
MTVVWITSLVYLVLHLTLPTWGWATPALNASLLRYALPALAFGILFLAYFSTGLFRYPVATTATGLAIVAIGVILLIAGPVGIRSRRFTIGQQAYIHGVVTHTTESDALIMTRVGDRFLLPDRQTLTLTYLRDPDDPENGSQDWNYVWDALPSAARVADVTTTILDRGIPLYLLGDFAADDVSTFVRAIKRAGVRVVAVDDEISLFRLSTIRSDKLPRNAGIPRASLSTRSRPR